MVEEPILEVKMMMAFCCVWGRGGGYCECGCGCVVGVVRCGGGLIRAYDVLFLIVYGSGGVRG